MDIPHDEYTQHRSLFEHCNWINLKLQALERTPNFYEAYFERKGLNIKPFLEEAIPVAYLGLYFWRTWRQISITCLTGNGPYDAVIELQDPRQRITMQIEVTTIETEESNLRRQALSRTGIVPFNGPIWRDNRTRLIHAQPEFVEVEAECERILDIAFQRFRAKAETEKDPATTILVYVDTNRRLPARHRYQLIERTRQYLLDHRPILHSVYYCYNPELGVDGLHNDVDDLW